MNIIEISLAFVSFLILVLAASQNKQLKQNEPERRQVNICFFLLKKIIHESLSRLHHILHFISNFSFFFSHAIEKIIID